jgi:hypothetical protein
LAHVHMLAGALRGETRTLAFSPATTMSSS